MSETLKFTNVYHNGETPPQPTERPEMTAFHRAAQAVLESATELARIVTNAHQGATALIVDGDWSQARKYFSLSEKYAAWADYATAATGFGIHGYITRLNQPLRFTQAELVAQPEWRDFGVESGKHPPMRGWLVMPLIGSDGLNYGLLQVSDRYEGDFSQLDQDNLARLARLTSTALDALAQAHFPDYQQKVQNAARPNNNV